LSVASAEGVSVEYPGHKNKRKSAQKRYRIFQKYFHEFPKWNDRLRASIAVLPVGRFGFSSHSDTNLVAILKKNFPKSSDFAIFNRLFHPNSVACNPWRLRPRRYRFLALGEQFFAQLARACIAMRRYERH
jgi:hypothetical protein